MEEDKITYARQFLLDLLENRGFASTRLNRKRENKIWRRKLKSILLSTNCVIEENLPNKAEDYYKISLLHLFYHELSHLQNDDESKLNNLSSDEEKENYLISAEEQADAYVSRIITLFDALP